MRKTNINFVGNIKKYLIISGSVFLIGFIIAIAFGVKLDIDFKGGTRFTYTYTGDISIDDAAKVIEDTINSDVDIQESTDITGGSTKLVVTLVQNDTIKASVQQDVTKALSDAFPNNKFELGDSNTVNSPLARGFFLKSLYSVAIAGALVIVYIGIRFRKIGGVSAGCMALVALLHDVIIAFLACVIFRLEVDDNFIAVVLSLFGYSLNDTVVIYDRIRENRNKNSRVPVSELVNSSINQTLGRTITTSVATFVAMLTVIVVSEVYGLTTLRSFAIPMAVGIISGSYSTICLSGPLWVKWIQHKEKKDAKNKYSKKKK